MKIQSKYLLKNHSEIFVYGYFAIFIAVLTLFPSSTKLILVSLIGLFALLFFFEAVIPEESKHDIKGLRWWVFMIILCSFMLTDIWDMAGDHHYQPAGLILIAFVGIGIRTFVDNVFDFIQTLRTGTTSEEDNKVEGLPVQLISGTKSPTDNKA